MRVSRTHTIAVTLIGTAFLTACGSTPKTPEKTASSLPPSTQPVNSADSRRVQPVNAGAADPLDDPKGALAKRSVFFDFDSYVIKPDYREVVTTHSTYLENHKARKIVIQGNTDERGGSEYNLALGQKRAEAVRKSMAASGVSDGQMEAVSFGKEKPKASGHDEAAWSQNRRADITYAGSGK